MNDVCHDHSSIYMIRYYLRLLRDLYTYIYIYLFIYYLYSNGKWVNPEYVQISICLLFSPSPPAEHGIYFPKKKKKKLTTPDNT